jgi:hypothetical protein
MAIDTADDIPQLSKDAYTGWIKDYCDWITPSTDGAIEGMFATASVTIGLAVGRTLHIYYGYPQYTNLFIVLLGLPGIARKTTLLYRAKTIRSGTFGGEDIVRTVSGMGSGEGLLEAFCDKQMQGEGKQRKEVLVPHPGALVLDLSCSILYYIVLNCISETGAGCRQPD